MQKIVMYLVCLFCGGVISLLLSEVASAEYKASIEVKQVQTAAGSLGSLVLPITRCSTPLVVKFHNFTPQEFPGATVTVDLSRIDSRMQAFSDPNCTTPIQSLLTSGGATETPYFYLKATSPFVNDYFSRRGYEDGKSVQVYLEANIYYYYRFAGHGSPNRYLITQAKRFVTVSSRVATILFDGQPNIGVDLDLIDLSRVSLIPQGSCSLPLKVRLEDFDPTISATESLKVNVTMLEVGRWSRALRPNEISPLFYSDPDCHQALNITHNGKYTNEFTFEMGGINRESGVFYVKFPYATTASITVGIDAITRQGDVRQYSESSRLFHTEKRILTPKILAPVSAQDFRGWPCLPFKITKSDPIADEIYLGYLGAGYAGFSSELSRMIINEVHPKNIEYFSNNTCAPASRLTTLATEYTPAIFRFFMGERANESGTIYVRPKTPFLNTQPRYVITANRLGQGQAMAPTLYSEHSMHFGLESTMFQSSAFEAPYQPVIEAPHLVIDDSDVVTSLTRGELAAQFRARTQAPRNYGNHANQPTCTGPYRIISAGGAFSSSEYEIIPSQNTAIFGGNDPTCSGSILAANLENNLYSITDFYEGKNPSTSNASLPPKHTVTLAGSSVSGTRVSGDFYISPISISSSPSRSPTIIRDYDINVYCGLTYIVGQQRIDQDCVTAFSIFPKQGLSSGARGVNYIMHLREQRY